MDDRVTIFESRRKALFRLAHRMLGSISESEDVVQDVAERWLGVDIESIRNPEAFLTSMVTRQCINVLSGARRQREVYPGPWLPEPLSVTTDELHPLELADDITWAMQALLQHLTPQERATYVLRQAFGMAYAEIAEILETDAANCRQWFSRGQKHLQAGPGRFEGRLEDASRLSYTFLRACQSGDLDAIRQFLASNATYTGDGGGRVPSALRPILGADRVARFLKGVAPRIPPGAEVHTAVIDGDPGWVITLGGHTVQIGVLTFSEGAIQGLQVLSNPEKLTRLRIHPHHEAEKDGLT